MIFEDERFRLIELQRDHLPQLNEWRNDPQITETLGGNFHFVAPEIDTAWYDTYLKNRATQVRLAIVATDTGAYIGNASLVNIHATNRGAEYSLLIGDRRYWGKGLGTAVTTATIAHAFTNLNLHRVYSYFVPYNAASIRMCEKAGMRQEGVLRDAVFKNGAYHDHVVMGIVRGDAPTA